jgi:hypothetical protein
MEILRTLIERLLSWPVAVLVLALYFRKPLTALLNRIDLFKGPGIEVSAPIGSASKQKIEAEKVPDEDQLAIGVPTQHELPLPEGLQERQHAVRTYGGDDHILLLQMTLIKEQLAELRLALDSEETAQILIRHLAATQLLYKAERVYRLIFGSQIAALRFLNENGQQPAESLRPMFERARSRSPKFYGEYPFEEWIGFLVGQHTVTPLNGSNRYDISVFGVEFLRWMTTTSVPRKMH